MAWRENYNKYHRISPVIKSAIILISDEIISLYLIASANNPTGDIQRKAIIVDGSDKNTCKITIEFNSVIY